MEAILLKILIFIWLPESHAAAAAAKSLQSCPTLCDPIDGSPPGFPVPEILQERTLEWVAIFFFSNAWKWKVKVKWLSCVLLFATPWTAAHQAPPSMGFSGQEYWSGLPSPSLIVLYGSQQTGKFLKRWDYKITSSASLETCMQIKKQQLELDVEQRTGSKLGKEYIKAVYWTLLIQLICRVHHAKCWAGLITCCNQDCQEKYQ